MNTKQIHKQRGVKRRYTALIGWLIFKLTSTEYLHATYFVLLSAD